MALAMVTILVGPSDPFCTSRTTRSALCMRFGALLCWQPMEAEKCVVHVAAMWSDDVCNLLLLRMQELRRCVEGRHNGEAGCAIHFCPDFIGILQACANSTGRVLGEHRHQNDIVNAVFRELTYCVRGERC